MLSFEVNINGSEAWSSSYLPSALDNGKAQLANDNFQNYTWLPFEY